MTYTPHRFPPRDDTPWLWPPNLRRGRWAHTRHQMALHRLPVSISRYYAGILFDAWRLREGGFWFVSINRRFAGICSPAGLDWFLQTYVRH